MSGWTHCSQQPVFFSLGETMQIWFQCKAPWKENKLLESGSRSSVLKLLTAEREFCLGMLRGGERKKEKQRRQSYSVFTSITKGCTGAQFLLTLIETAFLANTSIKR